MRQIMLLSTLLLLLALPATAAAAPVGEENTSGNLTTDTVAGIIETDRNLTVLARAIDATNLTGALQADWPYTVFTPEDSAFAAFGNATTVEFTAILQYHIVPGS